MAGRYRKVDTRIWNDARFIALGDDGRLVFLFILTHPHLTSLGAMRATVAGLGEELGWPTDRFAQALQGLAERGMVKHDQAARLLWLPKFLRYNAPESPNVVRAWAKALDLLPECDLRKQAIATARVTAESFGANFRQAFAEAFGEPFAKVSPSVPVGPSGNPSGRSNGNATAEVADTFGEPSRNQEQEQLTGTGLPDSGPAALRLVGPAHAGPESVAVLELIELWNLLRSSCNTVNPATISAKSRAMLRAALQTRSLDQWERLFRYVEANDYLAGRTGGLAPLSLWKALDLADRIEGGQYDSKPTPEATKAAADEWVPTKYRKGAQ